MLVRFFVFFVFALAAFTFNANTIFTRAVFFLDVLTNVTAVSVGILSL
jgi:hypothetical protein